MEIPRKLDFSSDGNWLATVTDSQPANVAVVYLFDLRSGKLAKQYDGHKDGLWTLQFSPDSRTLASASFDGTIRF